MTGVPGRLRSVEIQKAAALALVITTIIAYLLPASGLVPATYSLSDFQFRTQDLLPLVALFAIMRIAVPAPYEDSAVRGSRWNAIPVHSLAPAAAALLVAVGWAGHRYLFEGYSLSRDEQMADFDAWIFSHGRLFWLIPEEWRPFATALNQTFILPIGNHEAWVSAYLPVNALLRAGFGALATPALTNPVMTAVSALALWDIAKRLFPQDASTRLAVLALFVLSPQLLFTSMTAYAMPGHLAFNMVWLALFLRDRPYCHGAAMLVGFAATGLHQPLFHPLFALPFMLLPLRDRRWRLLACYGVVYAAIMAFWLTWPVWISSHASSYVAVQGSSASSFTDRMAMAWQGIPLKSVHLMLLNILRFATWQHLLLIPLMIAGVVGAWRTEPLLRALVLGFVLPAAAMIVLMAYQGHGWGYRYMHGVLGNACLIAGYGWRAVEAAGCSYRRALLIASAVTAFAIIPWYAVVIHRHVAPYAAIDRAIDSSGADLAVIDVTAAPFAWDLVLNRPDLGNRPLRVGVNMHEANDIGILCRGRSVAFFGHQQMALVATFFRVSPSAKDEGNALKLPGCDHGR